MEKAELQEAVDRGLSTRELAALFGFASSGPVTYWLRKHGLKTKHSGKRTPRTTYSREQLEEAVRASVSVNGALRHLGIELRSSSHAHLSRRIRDMGIDTSHFTRLGLRPPNRLSPLDVFVMAPEGSVRVRPEVLRRALLESGVDEVCALCGLGTEWQGLPLLLQVDHVDGNWRNNLQSNLRFLCPNCHTQQETSKKRKSVPR